jgi:C4-dicarboxylate-specific signal transduction histidine kinase
MFNSNDLIDKIDCGIIIIDKDFNIINWNEWLIIKTHIKRNDVINKNLNIVFENKISDKLIKCLNDSIKSGLSSVLTDRSKKAFLPLYKDILKKELLEQKIKITRIKNLEGQINCLIQIFDVTATNQKELFLIEQVKTVAQQTSELEHSNKLASLGRMASGIVHEINNPISVIKGYEMTYQIQRSKGAIDPTKMDEMMKKIQTMADRISHIIKGLKIIAHKDTFDFNQLVKLKTIIDESIELSKPKIEKSNVIVESEEINPDFEIWCDSIQISQIIINLISNAIDAISENPNPWIYISVLPNNNFYEIRVTDCGKGIPPEIVKQIWDPFFTSKRVGKGTGLGLSISQKIAEAHKGLLYVEENANNTTFVLKLVQAKYWA